MKILSIIKINLCALLAIPLLLLATCFRLITKAFEKIPVFLIEGLVIFVVVGMISVLKLPKNMGELIWHIILACIVIGIILALVGWVFSLISAIAMLIYNFLLACIDNLHSITYSGYLYLETVCERDYQLLSLNEKTWVNAVICPFYTLLKGLNRLIIIVISFSIPASVVLSIAFVAILLGDLNRNTKKVFGLNLLQFMKKCAPYSTGTGILLLFILICTVVITMFALAFEWTEWANELKVSSEEIKEDLAQLIDSELQGISESSEDAEPYMKYIDILQSHVDRLEGLGDQVQLLLEKDDNALLRNYWNAYMRNLQPLVEDFSADGGITLQKLKQRIPQIQMLDKQREDVRRMADKLEDTLKNPVGNSVFFSGCDTPEKLEKRFKSLCKTYHPDMAEGDTETFQKMKQEYESIKSSMDKETP